MPLLVRAYLVLPGMEEAAREFAQELAGPRGQEAADFYRSYDVLRETWHFQSTPQGSMVIVISEIAAEPKTEEYARSQEPFARWLKEQVLQLTGIDQDAQPLGPLTKLILSWNGEQLNAP